MADNNPFAFLSDIGDAIGGIGDSIGQMLTGQQDPGTAAPTPDAGAGAVDPSAGASGMPAAPAQANPLIAAGNAPMPTFGGAYQSTPQGLLGKLLGLGPDPSNVQSNLQTQTSTSLSQHEQALSALLSQQAKANPNASPQQLMLDAVSDPANHQLFASGAFTPAVIKDVMGQLTPDRTKLDMGQSLDQTTGTGDVAAAKPIASGIPNPAMFTQASVIDPSTPDGLAKAQALRLGITAENGPVKITTLKYPGFPEMVRTVEPLSSIASPAQAAKLAGITATTTRQTALVGKQSALLALNNGGEKLTKMLDKVNSPTGAVGALARTGLGLDSTVKQLIGAYQDAGQKAPIMDPSNKLYTSYFGNIGKWAGKAGINTAQVESAIMNFAYLNARAQVGSSGRVTETHIQNSLEQMGLNEHLTNPSEIKAALGNIIESANDNADSEWKAETQDGTWAPEVPPPTQPTIFLRNNGHSTFLPDPSAQGAQGQSGTAAPDFAQMSPGELRNFANSPALDKLPKPAQAAFVAAWKKLGTGAK